MARILLGVTGSVAAIRTPELVRALHQAEQDVRVIATRPALYFFDRRDLPPEVLFTDDDEWPRLGTDQAWQRSDPVLHIDMRRWADLLLIAPLDANTLAKLANGVSDNCLTCVWRAWDAARPVVLAPAMNTLMWEHRLTARHLRLLALAGAAPLDSDQDALVDWLNLTETSCKLSRPKVSGWPAATWVSGRWPRSTISLLRSIDCFDRSGQSRLSR